MIGKTSFELLTMSFETYSSRLVAHGSQLSLFRIQLYDQLLLNIFRNAFSFRISNESTFQFSFIPIQPAEFWIFCSYYACNRSSFSATGLNSNNIASF